MKASETKLSKVIEGTNQYLVPHYQRPYTWEQKHWKTLWDDIVDLCEPSEDDEGPSRQHFIGSIVTTQGHSVPEGVSKWILIDGQQRLTTIMLLLIALRDHAKSHERTRVASQINDLYLTNPYQEGAEFPKLLPTQGEDASKGDRAAFIALLEGREVDGGSALRTAYEFFFRQVQSPKAPDPDRLRQAIIGQMVLVSIVLDRDDNPYLVFESLNAKGQQLSQADLIRNYFFMRIHVDKHEAIYRELWKPMETGLEQQNTTEFIRHYLMKSGGNVKTNEVYFKLKARADKLPEAEVLAMLEALNEASTHYEKLLFPDREPLAELSIRLRRLNRLQATVAYPFLLNVYADYAQKKLPSQEFVGILDALENFILRRYVCRTIRAELQKIFLALYNNASRFGSLGQGVREVLADRGYPADSMFVEELISSPLYGTGPKRDRLRLILERLEEFHDHKERASLQNATIEHVMPQKLTASWKKQLGADYEDVHGTFLHTIGNLTLTAYNSDLSNLDYEEKRKILGESNFVLNRQLSRFQRWTAEEIRARAKDLGDTALKVWPHFGTGKAGSSRATESVKGKQPVSVFILGQTFPTRTWQAVLQRTVREISLLGEDVIEDLAEALPRYVSKNPEGMRTPKEFSEGYYYEAHHSADSIHRLCKQMTQVAGLSGEEWYVELA